MFNYRFSFQFYTKQFTKRKVFFRSDSNSFKKLYSNRKFIWGIIGVIGLLLTINRRCRILEG